MFLPDCGRNPVDVNVKRDRSYEKGVYISTESRGRVIPRKRIGVSSRDTDGLELAGKIVKRDEIKRRIVCRGRL